MPVPNGESAVLGACTGAESVPGPKAESSTRVAKCTVATVSFIVSPGVSLRCERTMIAVGTMFCRSRRATREEMCRPESGT